MHECAEYSRVSQEEDHEDLQVLRPRDRGGIDVLRIGRHVVAEEPPVRECLLKRMRDAEGLVELHVPEGIAHDQEGGGRDEGSEELLRQRIDEVLGVDQAAVDQ